MGSVREPLSSRRFDDVDMDRDRALVERCQSGDTRAFDDLYLRYRERLYRTCLRRTGNPSEAEDLVQETFARAWKALPRFAGDRRFYPWLSVIANNLCADLARRGGKCMPVEESDLDLLAPAVAAPQEELVDSNGDVEMLTLALDRISARHREVLELRERRNWTYQQIASHSGVEVSTIETLLFRARRSLRREFLTLARAETGIAGVLAFPLVALRRLGARARHVARHSALGTKLASAASAASAVPVVSGAIVAVGAAAATASVVALTHHEHAARSARTAEITARPGHGGAATGTASTSTRVASESTSRSSSKDASSPTLATHHRTSSTSSTSTAGGSGTVGSASGTGTTTVSGATGSVSQLGGTVNGVVSGTTTKVAGGVSSGVSTVTGVTSGVSGISSGVSGISSGVSGISSGVSSVTGGTGGLGGGLP